MSETRENRLAAFKAALAGADPTALLVAAEAAGNINAACDVIAASVSYPNRYPMQPGDLDQDERRMLNQEICQRLIDLRPIAQAKGFAWIY